MKHKFFNIPTLYSEQAEAALNSFCDQHRIASVEKQFVADGGNSCWAVCVTWLGQEGELAGSTSVKSKKPRVDYKEVLSEENFIIFSRLRDLRTELSKQEGIAVYNIFTNEQLAKMVEERLTTKKDLLDIEGIGPTRVEKYAEAFLQPIREWAAQ